MNDVMFQTDNFEQPEVSKMFEQYDIIPVQNVVNIQCLIGIRGLFAARMATGATPETGARLT